MTELTPIEKAQIAMAEKRAAGWKPERLDPIEKARRNPTRANCIRAKCYDCQGRGADPGWIQAVATCASTLCPLVPVRPYQSKTEDDDAA